jgi:hypothetical protein
MEAISRRTRRSTHKSESLEPEADGLESTLNDAADFGDGIEGNEPDMPVAVFPLLALAIVAWLGGSAFGRDLQKDWGETSAVDAGDRGRSVAGGSRTVAAARSGDTCPSALSTLVSYRIAGQFRLSGTALGSSDGEWPLPGKASRDGGTPPVETTAPNLVLRIMPDRRVSVVSFELPHNVHQAIVGTGVFTNMLHLVPRTPCGAAHGSLLGTTIVWDTCATPPAYGSRRWSPAELATGPGCLSGFGDVGNIWCQGWACALGGLASGDNKVAQPPLWNQPLPPFRFESPDLSTFSTDFFDLPNERGSARTQMAITSGREIGRVQEITPACACR